MTPRELSRAIGVPDKRIRHFLRNAFSRETDEVWTRWRLTYEQIEAVRRHFGKRNPCDSTSSEGSKLPSTDFPVRPPQVRASRDEHYVIDICDMVLNERSLRQHRFDWLRGDPNRQGRSTTLPVDAYYPRARLVIEFREPQHDEENRFFDKPEKVTVSGVHRGEQRRSYDRRREEQIPAYGLHLVVIWYHQLDHDSRGRLRRNSEGDELAIRALLSQFVH